MTSLSSAMQDLPSVYAAVGPKLLHFRLDQERAELEQRGELLLPSRIQYACPHASLPILYVACADRGGADGAEPFYLCAVQRHPDGALSLHGQPMQLPARPIHVTVDPDSRFIVTTFSQPATVTVHDVRADGSVGDEIAQDPMLDLGSHPHHVRFMASGNRAILSARGKKGFGKPSYIGGGLHILSFRDGRFANVEIIAPGAAFAPAGFNPRHVDIHPNGGLLFAALEEQSEVAVFRIDGEAIDPVPLNIHTTLAQPDAVRPRQDGGMVEAHANGRFVYAGNRNDGYVGGANGPSWLTPDPIPIFPGGENGVAVFAVDAGTGALTCIQVAESGGIHPRCFAFDPSGSILIVANLAPTILRDGDALHNVPAGLALFRVQSDGKVEFVRRHDIDVAGEMLWWMGVAA